MLEELWSQPCQRAPKKIENVGLFGLCELDKYMEISEKLGGYCQLVEWKNLRCFKALAKKKFFQNTSC